MNVMQRLNLTWTKVTLNTWVLHFKNIKPHNHADYGFIKKDRDGYVSSVAGSNFLGAPPSYDFIHKTLAESKTSLLRRVARMYPEKPLKRRK